MCQARITNAEKTCHHLGFWSQGLLHIAERFRVQIVFRHPDPWSSGGQSVEIRRGQRVWYLRFSDAELGPLTPRTFRGEKQPKVSLGQSSSIAMRTKKRSISSVIPMTDTSRSRLRMAVFLGQKGGGSGHSHSRQALVFSIFSPAHDARDPCYSEEGSARPCTRTRRKHARCARITESAEQRLLGACRGTHCAMLLRGFKYLCMSCGVSLSGRVFSRNSSWVPRE